MEGKILKDFIDYRMSLELFEDLKDGDKNPEVSKSQVKFKVELNEIKTGIHGSEDQKYIIRNVFFFLIYEKNLFVFLDIILFSYLKLNTKQNMDEDLKYYPLPPPLNKCFKD